MHPSENIKLKVTLYTGTCSNLLLMSFIYYLRLGLILNLTSCSFIHKSDLLEKETKRFQEKYQVFNASHLFLHSPLFPRLVQDEQ